MEQDILLQMVDISKSFPGVKALDNVVNFSYSEKFRAIPFMLKCRIRSESAAANKIFKSINGSHFHIFADNSAEFISIHSSLFLNFQSIKKRVYLSLRNVQKLHSFHNVGPMPVGVIV